MKNLTWIVSNDSALSGSLRYTLHGFTAVTFEIAYLVTVIFPLGNILTQCLRKISYSYYTSENNLFQRLSSCKENHYAWEHYYHFIGKTTFVTSCLLSKKKQKKKTDLFVEGLIWNVIKWNSLLRKKVSFWGGPYEQVFSFPLLRTHKSNK